MSTTVPNTPGATPLVPRWRDVYLAAGARAGSVCGDFIAATALLLTLQARGSGGYAVATILLATTVPPVALASLTGRIADRVDSRTLVVTTGSIQTVAAVALAYTPSVAGIAALLAVLSIGLAINKAALSALTPDMVGHENLARAGAIGQTLGSIGFLAAPALGGLLVGRFGIQVPLLVNAATYVLIVIAGATIRTRRSGNPRTATAMPAEAARGAWRVREDSLLFAFLVVVAAGIGSVSIVNVLDVFFLRGTLHATPTTYGLISSTWMLGMVAGNVLLGRVAPDLGRLLRIGIALMAGTAAVITAAAFAPDPSWMFVLWGIGGLTNGGVNVVVVVIVGHRAPEQALGHAYAIFGAAADGAGALGYVAGGALLAWLPTRTAMFSVGVVSLLAVAACGAPALRALRGVRAAPPSASPDDFTAAIATPTIHDGE